MAIGLGLVGVHLGPQARRDEGKEQVEARLVGVRVRVRARVRVRVRVGVGVKSRWRRAVSESTSAWTAATLCTRLHTAHSNWVGVGARGRR